MNSSRFKLARLCAQGLFLGLWMNVVLCRHDDALVNWEEVESAETENNPSVLQELLTKYGIADSKKKLPTKLTFDGNVFLTSGYVHHIQDKARLAGAAQTEATTLPSKENRNSHNTNFHTKRVLSAAEGELKNSKHSQSPKEIIEKSWVEVLKDKNNFEVTEGSGEVNNVIGSKFVELNESENISSSTPRSVSRYPQRNISDTLDLQNLTSTMSSNTISSETSSHVGTRGDRATSSYTYYNYTSSSDKLEIQNSTMLAENDPTPFSVNQLDSVDNSTWSSNVGPFTSQAPKEFIETSTSLRNDNQLDMIHTTDIIHETSGKISLMGLPRNKSDTNSNDANKTGIGNTGRTEKPEDRLPGTVIPVKDDTLNESHNQNSSKNDQTEISTMAPDVFTNHKQEGDTNLFMSKNITNERNDSVNELTTVETIDTDIASTHSPPPADTVESLNNPITDLNSKEQSTLSFTHDYNEEITTFSAQTVQGSPDTYPSVIETLDYTTFHFTIENDPSNTTQPITRVKRTTSRDKTPITKKHFKDTSKTDKESKRGDYTTLSATYPYDQSEDLMTSTPNGMTDKSKNRNRKGTNVSQTLKLDESKTEAILVENTDAMSTMRVTATPTTESTTKDLKGWNQTCSAEGSCADEFKCEMEANQVLRRCVCPRNQSYSQTLQMCKSEEYWTRLNFTFKDLTISWKLESPEAAKDVERYVVKYGEKYKTSQNPEKRDAVKNSYTFPELSLGKKYIAHVDLILSNGKTLESQSYPFSYRYDTKLLSSDTDLSHQYPNLTYTFSAGCYKTIKAKMTNVEDSTDTLNITFGSNSGCPNTQFSKSKKLKTLRRGSKYKVDLQLEFLSNTEITSSYLHTNPAPPSDLKVVWHGVNHLIVVWNRPTEGNVHSYRIETKLRGLVVKSTEVLSNVSRHNITALDSGRTYQINVYSNYYNRTSSSCISADTTSLVPEKPRLLQWNKTNMALTWSEPKHIHFATIEYYDVVFNCTKTGNNQTRTESTSYVINSIRKDECCSFSVSAVSSKGKGIPRYYKKQPIVPVTEIQIVNDITKQIEGHSAVIGWKLSTDNAAGLIYKIKVTLKKDEKRIATQTFFCKGDACIYPCKFQRITTNKTYAPEQTIFDAPFSVKPNTSYIVWIIPFTAEGKEGKKKITFTTPESPPTSAIRDFYIIRTDQRTIQAQWDAPTESNGVILKYNVSLDYLFQDCSAGYIQSKRTESFKVLAANITNLYTIDGLFPFTNYSLSVTAINSAGQSLNWSNPFTFRTKPKEDSLVQHIKHTVHSRSVELSWKPPCPITQSLSFYTVNVNCEETDPQKTPDTSFTIMDLNPATKYSICIGIENSRTPKKIFITTEMDAPTSAIRDFYIIRTDQRTIQAQWDAPTESNGVILKYNVSLDYLFQDCSAGYIQSKRTESFKVLAANITNLYTIDGLFPFTNYSLSVTAINSAGQSLNWSNPFTFRTKPKEDSLVQHIKHTVHSRSVELSWKPPCPITQSLSFYTVNVNCEETDPQKTPDTSFTIMDLNPATKYSICIGIENSRTPKKIFITTEMDAPGPVEMLSVTQEEQLDMERRLYVNWSAPLTPNGQIREYIVRLYPECGDKKPVWINTTNTFLSIPAIPECNYLVEVNARTDAAPGDKKEQNIFIKPGVLPKPKETSYQPIVHQGGRCSHVDATTSILLNLPLSFLCNTNFGQISYRGVLVMKEAERETEQPDPKVVIQPNISLQEQPLPMGTNNLRNEEDKPYHLVVLSPQDVPCNGELSGSSAQCSETISGGIFQYVIGTETQCSTSGCNKVLDSGTRYRFKAFVCTYAGCTVSLKSRVVRTEEIKVDKSSLVIGVVFSSIIIIILIIISVVIYRNKRGVVKAIRRFQKMSLREHETVEMEATSLPTKPIKLADLISGVETMHQDSNLIFSEEYKLLTQLSYKGETTIAQLPAHRAKNRYSNVLPFDHARVKLLPLDDDEPSDYINASFIPGQRGPREYIAAQGPLKCTIDDFWRMIWEKRVYAIVMLTQCTEKGKVKCEQYWPYESSWSEMYGDLKVLLRSESVLPDYIIRVMDLELGNTKRTIHQFHFLKWPDFGCPEQTYLLLNLVAAVRDHTPYKPHSPMVIHCSAGVGRSGTYIALDTLLQQIKEQGLQEIDIFSLVLGMRKNRPLMVQRENQYIYIHDCLRDALLDESDDENSLMDEHIYQNT